MLLVPRPAVQVINQSSLVNSLSLPRVHIPSGNVVLDILPVFYVKGLLLSLICDAKA